MKSILNLLVEVAAPEGPAVENRAVAENGAEGDKRTQLPLRNA